MIKLIRCDRTCQRSITIIIKDNSFSPNTRLTTEPLLSSNFCLKESSRRDLSEHKSHLSKNDTFYSSCYLKFRGLLPRKFYFCVLRPGCHVFSLLRSCRHMVVTYFSLFSLLARKAANKNCLTDSKSSENGKENITH